ncbi:GNAT family N-acetyltransferase [Pseudomarimonas salicorniae]|uniref:GNAT family N-acetyltransferase n=1 Tax=Pseudomarimonas salicorniae TaxID=2933270 RepID=A0ABT0GHW9_9GAMM|nr:GNAT family N-acetyltransferase [Lysobacter sp. CAU 1642]MCK7593610.1 GNAT family N-acetyltransferase [Lysobacter sp. CAU 1642]
MTLLTDRIAALAARLHGLAGFPVIEDDMIRLRAPGEADVDPLFALFSDHEVMRYWSRPAMQHRDEAVDYVSSIREGFAKREFINWIIAERDTDRMSGTCTFYDIQPSHLRSGIGYAVLPAEQGRGIASQAVGLACAWGFGWLDLHRVEADIHPDNHASRRVLERAGFQREGLLRQRFVTPQEIQDSELYGLLAPS